MSVYSFEMKKIEQAKIISQGFTKQRAMIFASILADSRNLDPELIYKQIAQESSWMVNAVSDMGAIGLMQLMPLTANDLKVDRYLWTDNVVGGIKYMATLMKLYDRNYSKAFAAYNCGPGKVNGLIATHGDLWKRKLPNETQNYLVRILGEGILNI